MEYATKPIALMTKQKRQQIFQRHIVIIHTYITQCPFFQLVIVSSGWLYNIILPCFFFLFLFWCIFCSYKSIVLKLINFFHFMNIFHIYFVCFFSSFWYFVWIIYLILFFKYMSNQDKCMYIYWILQELFKSSNDKSSKNDNSK